MGPARRHGRRPAAARGRPHGHASDRLEHSLGSRGGIVVDARGGKLRIRRVPSMANGRMVVLQDGETQVFDREQENDGKALLQDLMPKFGKKVS